MATRNVSNWRRPYTSIYNDNYRYGTGLYSDTLTDIEKRYSDSLSKTQLRSDRRDLTFSTFADSTLTSSLSPGVDAGGSSRETPTFSRQKSIKSSSPANDLVRSSTFESRLNSALHSSYALDDEVLDAINSRKEHRLQKAMERNAVEPLSSRPKSLYDDAVFWTLPKTTENLNLEVDTTKNKRKFGGSEVSTNGPRVAHWREKSRVIEEQVESLERNMSDCSNKLSSELSSLKAKYHNEISDLNRSVEQTTDQASDLQKICKRQAHQLLELQSAYDDSQRNIQDALEEMNLWQNRCKCLKKEMDKLRQEVEQAVHKTSRD